MSVPDRGRQELYPAAWDAFANQDRATRAPAALESRVRRAVASRAVVRHSHRWNGVDVPRAWRPAAMAAVGGLALSAAIGMGLSWLASRGQVEPMPHDIVLLDRAPVAVHPPSLVTGDAPVVTHPTAPARVRMPHLGPAAAKPLAATSAPPPGEPRESLQMVRLRMPLSELGALGVRLSGASGLSHGAGWVEVDVVVGLDGWPCDVLRIATVDPGEL